MSPRRIPITTAKAVVTKHPDVKQVILLAWDGERTHVVTYGKTHRDCEQAAAGGTEVKCNLGWPENKT